MSRRSSILSQKHLSICTMFNEIPQKQIKTKLKKISSQILENSIEQIQTLIEMFSLLKPTQEKENQKISNFLGECENLTIKTRNEVIKLMTDFKFSIPSLDEPTFGKISNLVNNLKIGFKENSLISNPNIWDSQIKDIFKIFKNEKKINFPNQMKESRNFSTGKRRNTLGNSTIQEYSQNRYIESRRISDASSVRRLSGTPTKLFRSSTTKYYRVDNRGNKILIKNPKLLISPSQNIRRSSLNRPLLQKKIPINIPKSPTVLKKQLISPNLTPTQNKKENYTFSDKKMNTKSKLKQNCFLNNSSNKGSPYVLTPVKPSNRGSKKAIYRSPITMTEKDKVVMCVDELTGEKVKKIMTPRGKKIKRVVTESGKKFVMTPSLLNRLKPLDQENFQPGGIGVLTPQRGSRIAGGRTGLSLGDISGGKKLFQDQYSPVGKSKGGGEESKNDFSKAVREEFDVTKSEFFGEFNFFN